MPEYLKNFLIDNSVIRMILYIFAPFTKRIRIKYDEFRYREYSYKDEFIWNWESTNFNRIALINFLASKVQNCSYLEIGCANNSLFDSIPIMDKIGVDPGSGGTHRMTSDAYFNQNVKKFDVIFIDGLHTYMQVRQDTINAINSIKKGGWIALHDMLPGNWKAQHVPQISGIWNGDVWKVAFELASTEGIEFKIVKIDHGCGVFQITKENPQLVDMTTELIDQKFSYFFENIEKLPLIDWNTARSWVSESKTY